jgi:phytoene synthase
MTRDPIQHCEEIIGYHSKSFSLASRLLPAPVRRRAVVVYAWCRRADDAVDHAPPGWQLEALQRLRTELGEVYDGRPLKDPVLSAFQQVVRECGIHRAYPDELLSGMAMDVAGTRYDSMDTFLLYCYRVAGTVGLMMSHVMGLSDEGAVRHAVHLGMAMQMTNICRDVLEDWQRGRLYIPEEMLAAQDCPRLSDRLGGDFPERAREPVARATGALLEMADRFYASGDRGLHALDWRCALSIRTARNVYSAIGQRVRRAGCDPLAGRAIVPLRQKLLLVAAALGRSFDGRGAASGTAASLARCVAFPEDVMPVES